MNIVFKIPRPLLSSIREDLARPHKFAFERVGFISTSFSLGKEALLVLAREYRPVADEDYLEDNTVGAMMGPEAIRKALQWASKEKVGIFHVHSHGGSGCPGFSRTDLREQAKFVPNFFQLAPQCAHGALVLSNTSAYGHIWLSSQQTFRVINRFAEVGAPLQLWSPLEYEKI